MAKGLDDDLNRFYGGDYSFGEKVVTTYKPTMQCYGTHPPLEIPGTGLKIYGGSCIHPVIQDADIYIGFDHGMKMTSRAYPWTSGQEFLFEIQDMSAPKDAGAFKELIAWTSSRLQEGAKVHCGCIGGHGRTGTFLAALVCEMTGEKDAISYVRENYCSKAVETASQARFLSEHFGIKAVGGSRAPVFVNAPEKPKKLKGIKQPEQEEVVERIAAIGGFSIWD